VPKFSGLAAECNPRSLKKWAADVKYAAALMNLDDDHAVTFAMSKLSDNAAGWATMATNQEGEFINLMDFFNRFDDHYFPVNADMDYRGQMRDFKQGKKERVGDAALRFQEITYQIDANIDEQDKAFNFLAGLRDDLKGNVINFMTMMGQMSSPTMKEIVESARRAEEAVNRMPTISVNGVKTEKPHKKTKTVSKTYQASQKDPSVTIEDIKIKEVREPWSESKTKLYEENKCFK
jgi:hypothetical protein